MENQDKRVVLCGANAYEQKKNAIGAAGAPAPSAFPQAWELRW